MSKAERLYQLERPPFTSVSVKDSNAYFYHYSVVCLLHIPSRFFLRNRWVPYKMQMNFYFQREFHTKFTNLVGPLSLFEPEDSAGKRLIIHVFSCGEYHAGAIYYVEYTICL